MIGLDQQTHDSWFVDSWFFAPGVQQDFIPDPTPCSRFSWLSDDLVFMLDRQDYSCIAAAVCADVYGLGVVLVSGSSAMASTVSLGDFFAGDLIAASSDINVALNVDTGRVSPASLGKPGYDAPLVDSVEDSTAVQSVKFQEWLFNLDPIIFEPETIALLERSTTDVPYAQQVRINRVFKAIKASAVITKIDAFYLPMRWQDEQAGCLDWLRDVAASIHGTASWSADYGFVGSTSASSGVNSNFTPSVNGVNFSINSASIGFLVTDRNTVNGYLTARGGGLSTRLTSVNSGYNNSVSMSLNSGFTLTSPAGSGIEGLHVVARSGGVLSHRRDGTIISSASNNAQSISIDSIWICSGLNGVLPSNVKIGAWFAGAYLDQYEQQVLIDAITEYCI